jgi:hypothetical protein
MLVDEAFSEADRVPFSAKVLLEFGPATLVEAFPEASDSVRRRLAARLGLSGEVPPSSVVRVRGGPAAVEDEIGVAVVVGAAVVAAASTSSSYCPSVCGSGGAPPNGCALTPISANPAPGAGCCWCCWC